MTAAWFSPRRELVDAENVSGWGEGALETILRRAEAEGEVAVRYPG